MVCDEYSVPLADTDGDLDPDTGVMASGAAMTVIVQVTIPLSPTSRVEDTTIVATSDLDTSNTAQVTLVTESFTAMFAPPHSDSGDDSDIDGLYEYMVVDVSVEVFFDGTYYIYADLYDTSWNYITGLNSANSLSPGSYSVSFSFDGPTLFAFGSDGPYYVDLYMWDDFDYQGYDSHTTSSYLYTDFERPIAYFDPPHSDWGYDAGTDGLYDLLVVDLGVTSSLEGAYRIDANLYDVSMTYITSVSYDLYLMVGWQIVQLQFSGEQLYSWGVSGEYYVRAYLYDEWWTALDTHEYMTAYYAYDEFQPPGASFSPPHSEYTVDSNADGYYEYLVIEVQVDSIRSRHLSGLRRTVRRLGRMDHILVQHHLSRHRPTDGRALVLGL